MWPGTQHAIGFIISSGNVSLFLALLYLRRDGTCMTCSVAIPTTAITTAIIAWWIDEKIPKNGSINALLTTIKATQLGWRCWAKDERKLSSFSLCSLPTPSFSYETRQMHTHVNMFHTDIRLLTTRQHVIIYFFFTISSLLLCSF